MTVTIFEFFLEKLLSGVVTGAGVGVVGGGHGCERVVSGRGRAVRRQGRGTIAAVIR